MLQIIYSQPILSNEADTKYHVYKVSFPIKDFEHMTSQPVDYCALSDINLYIQTRLGGFTNNNDKKSFLIFKNFP